LEDAACARTSDVITLVDSPIAQTVGCAHGAGLSYA
jgi:hypothetical protein